MKQQKVVIIGAGIGGMATANLLAKAGYEVHVYEKDSMPGGRIGLLAKDGYRFDTGPSWYLMPEVFAHHYELLGESVDKQLDLIRLDPAYKVFFENQPALTVTSDLEKDIKMFDSIESGAGKSLRTYVKRGSTIYDLSLKHFLYSNFTSLHDFLKLEVIRNGFTMLKLAFLPIDRYVRSFVDDLRLKQILEYPMVFLGTSPFTAPSIYSLMSALDFKEGVYYPMGGMYTIITSFENIGISLGVNYHYNSSITNITTNNKQVAGIKLASGETVSADIIISNSDLHYTETKLLKPEDQSYPESYWNKKQAGPSALLMYLGVKDELKKLKHHNLLFVESWKENFEAIYGTKNLPEKASIYIGVSSKSDAATAPVGHHNVFVLVPLPSGIDIDKPEVERLADHYIAQIEKMTGTNLKSNIVSQTLFGPNDFKTKFFSWESSMLGPSHLLRQSAFLRTPNKSKKVKNLYYVGAGTTPGIGLPMCLISAELVYKRLSGDTLGGQVIGINPSLGHKND